MKLTHQCYTKNPGAIIPVHSFSRYYISLFGCVMMRIRDLEGTEFTGPVEALRELRLRAERAILDGDGQGVDVRKWIVRLRDDAGSVLFEGTLVEATRAGLDDKGVPPQ